MRRSPTLPCSPRIFAKRPSAGSASPTETSVELVRSERACDFGVRYISVIGTGTASIVVNPAEKSRICGLFMEKYAGGGGWSTPRRRSVRRP